MVYLIFNTIESTKTLAPATIIRIHALVSVVLSEASRDGLISSNPAEKARLPRIKKKEADFLEPDELAAVLNAADNEPLNKRLLIYLLAATGGRRGEILGLR